ncbi:MAG: hypothetical protein WC528_05030 [Patescibacteria group bacterium]
MAREQGLSHNPEEEKILSLLAEKKNLDNREISNLAFQEIVLSKLTGQFGQEMLKAGIKPECVEQITVNILAIQDKKIVSQMLALPAKMRESRFVTYAQSGKSAQEILKDMTILIEQTTNALGGAPVLGFHTSRTKISPHERYNPATSTNERLWVVSGTEHTDYAETPQAYAARDYEHLYRKKGDPAYIYLVRDNEKNEIDPTTGWSRASSFDVIAELKTAEVDQEIENIVSRLRTVA